MVGNVDFVGIRMPLFSTKDVGFSLPLRLIARSAGSDLQAVAWLNSGPVCVCTRAKTMDPVRLGLSLRPYGPCHFVQVLFIQKGWTSFVGNALRLARVQLFKKVGQTSLKITSDWPVTNFSKKLAKFDASRYQACNDDLCSATYSDIVEFARSQ